MTAVLLEVGERWPFAVWYWPLAATLAAASFTEWWRGATLLFLALSCVDIVVRFPDVANHVNLELYLNVAIAAAMLLSRNATPSSSRYDDTPYGLIRPIVQAAAIVMYVLAGFHKLNADFLNTDVSCARLFSGRLSNAMRATSFGVAATSGLILILASAWKPTRGKPRTRLAVATVSATLLAAIALSGTSPGLRQAVNELPAIVVRATAALVLGWELAGGVLLVFPAFQPPMLALSWLMHGSLSLIGFVDFGALALAMLFTFLPAAYADLLTRPARAPLAGIAFDRVKLYVVINILMTLMKGVPGADAILAFEIYQGLIFNAAAFLLLWPILQCAWRSCPPWTSRPLWASGRSLWLLAPTLVVVAHGLTGYLGLRTAGNFSMFSNLKTEGARSNHLLLGGNPVKVWGYQEDVVNVLEIDDERAFIGHHYGRLKGMLLPVTEFRKRILLWRQAGMVVPVTFTYRGHTYVSSNIAEDSTWARSKPTWAMKLLDFREIQPGGPNECRW